MRHLVICKEGKKKITIEGEITLELIENAIRLHFSLGDEDLQIEVYEKDCEMYDEFLEMDTPLECKSKLRVTINEKSSSNISTEAPPAQEAAVATCSTPHQSTSVNGQGPSNSRYYILLINLRFVTSVYKVEEVMFSL